MLDSELGTGALPVLERLVSEVAGLRQLLEAERVNGPNQESQKLDDSAFSFGGNRSHEPGALHGSELRLTRSTRPALPEPRLIRRIIRLRQMRGRFFDADLFADPAWDMLLDLAASHAEYSRVSVTSLCIASGVPPTTALRWIGQMVEAGIFQRIEDQMDRRRAFIALSDEAADAMARYFAATGASAQLAI